MKRLFAAALALCALPAVSNAPAPAVCVVDIKWVAAGGPDAVTLSITPGCDILSAKRAVDAARAQLSRVKGSQVIP